jgi:hypothetical protein
VSLIGCCAALASFGRVFTANRADSLLLLFATLGLWCAVRLPGRRGLLAAALLAGLAANLKLHGPAYLLPALGLWAARNFAIGGDGLRNWWLAVPAAFVAGAAGLILPFVPANVSLENYLQFLRLGTKHGLYLAIFAGNATLLLSLWVPTLFVLGARRRERAMPPWELLAFAAVLFAAEIAVTVVASKPGAGVHHLLPFVAFHAFLLQQLLVGTAPAGDIGSWRDFPVARAAVTGVAAVLMGAAWPAAAEMHALLLFDLQGPLQRAQSEELRRFADSYPHGMLGIAGRATYPLTILRPWISLGGTPQTDYGAWMDWSLSGLSDAPLATALQDCRIPYLFVPTGDLPFTMDNSYDLRPLFSDAVRSGFTNNYALIHPGQFFDVYGCATSKTSLRRASQ